MNYMVTGAFSFTGRHVTKRLLQEGHQVRTMTRRPQEMSPFSQDVAAVDHDYDDIDSLAQAMDGCDCLINTYWRRQPEGGLAHDRVVEQSKNLFAAAQAVGIQRIVHISISEPDKKNYPYFKAKCATEKAVRDCGIPCVIVRPQLVFGDGELLINNLAWSLRRFRIAVVPGDGRFLLQPIHADDYAYLITDLSRTHQSGSVDAVGPDVLTYDEIVRMVGKAIGHEPKILHVSPWIFSRLARSMNLFMKEPTVLEYEIYGCLVENRLVPRAPQGSKPLIDWLERRGDTLGRRYAGQDDRPFVEG